MRRSHDPPVDGLDPVTMLEHGHPVFLVGETMTRNMMAAAHGDEPAWRVVVALNGKWNHGADDRALLMLAPDNAVDIAMSLVGGALACGYDEAVLAAVEQWLDQLDEP